MRPKPKPDICNPNPCGPSAIPKPRNGVCTCKCPSGLFGDPYLGCRPECVLNSDCNRLQACSNNKCVDPCPGTCGTNAECKVINHIPTCGCRKGFTGNAFEECTKPKRKHGYLTIDFNPVFFLKIINILQINTAGLKKIV